MTVTSEPGKGSMLQCGYRAARHHHNRTLLAGSDEKQATQCPSWYQPLTSRPALLMSPFAIMRHGIFSVRARARV